MKLDGCIVWNSCNKIFDSKLSAICVLAVYVLHCTQSAPDFIFTFGGVIAERVNIARTRR